MDPMVGVTELTSIRAGVEEHRPEGQLARGRHMVSGLELQHRRFCRRRELVAPEVAGHSQGRPGWC